MSSACINQLTILCVQYLYQSVDHSVCPVAVSIIWLFCVSRMCFTLRHQVAEATVTQTVAVICCARLKQRKPRQVDRNHSCLGVCIATSCCRSQPKRERERESQWSIDWRRVRSKKENCCFLLHASLRIILFSNFQRLHFFCSCLLLNSMSIDRLNVVKQNDNNLKLWHCFSLNNKNVQIK